jgi:hypothetical protein
MPALRFVVHTGRRRQNDGALHPVGHGMRDVVLCIGATDEPGERKISGNLPVVRRGLRRMRRSLRKTPERTLPRMRENLSFVCGNVPENGSLTVNYSNFAMIASSVMLSASAL